MNAKSCVLFSYFKTQLIVESESVEAGEHAYKDLLKSFKRKQLAYDLPC